MARPFFGGIGCIIALHRIVPEKRLSKLPDNRALELTPQDLRAALEWTRRQARYPPVRSYEAPRVRHLAAGAISNDSPFDQHIDRRHAARHA